MMPSKFYKRSLSTKNEDNSKEQTIFKHHQINLTPIKKRVNLSRIDGYENIVSQLYTPRQIKNIGYPPKIFKQSAYLEETPFNNIVQGYFLPTPRKTQLQINKIITEPTTFNNSPIKKQEKNYIILKNKTDQEYDLDRQLNIPQKIRLYFSCQKLQKRFFKLQELLSFISIKSIFQYLNDQNSSIIDYIAEYDVQYKQFILTEFLCIILYFLIKYNLIQRDELTRLEKLILYQHQQNACNVIHKLQIHVPGFKTYMHLFFQLQQANPVIPKQIDLLNKYIDKTIDDLIKTIVNSQLQQHIREFLFMKIEQKTSDFIDKLKKIIESIQEFLYFLPKNEKEYTLILDLEETLIHIDNNNNGQIKKRPYLQEFLEELSRYYEIAVFGHLSQIEIDNIIQQLDCNQFIKHKLNRNHLMKYEKVLIKDLTLLGRPANKYIVVDNDPFNFLLSPQNGIQIRSWYGEQGDHALLDLLPFLGDLRLYKDVRIGLTQVKTYSQYFFVPQ
ncbi:unnamed protein product [Paramecium sonneborni]|uniref:Mitochondrial import inner membrane translocase subunit TIM50 n=1 Tax=Paramecium sonneborni TaxID=65129 RepID=A0A8S1QQ60_9CILI|nr:unnamed protein product [Paramecium sonneborni]